MIRFGFLTPYRYANPATIAPIIRDIAASGADYEGIAAELNARGVPTARDARWSGRTVRKVMRRFGITLDRSRLVCSDPRRSAGFERGRATQKAHRDARDAEMLPLSSTACRHAYTRVSTTEHAQGGYSLGEQERQLREIALARQFPDKDFRVSGNVPLAERPEGGNMVFCDSFEQVPRRILLDIDDTEDRVHGGQQLALFNTHYDSRCFLPIHIYEAPTGKPVAVILRPGKGLTGPRWRWCCAMSLAGSAPAGRRSRSSCAATAITAGPRPWRGASVSRSATSSASLVTRCCCSS